MAGDRFRAAADWAYARVELALWAALFAFAAYFGVFIAPKLPEARAQAQELRAREIAAENEFYCAKWGMTASAPMRGQCIQDLQTLREQIEKRIAEEDGF